MAVLFNRMNSSQFLAKSKRYCLPTTREPDLKICIRLQKIMNNQRISENFHIQSSKVVYVYVYMFVYVYVYVHVYDVCSWRSLLSFLAKIKCSAWLQASQSFLRKVPTHCSGHGSVRGKESFSSSSTPTHICQQNVQNLPRNMQFFPREIKTPFCLWQ